MATDVKINPSRPRLGEMEITSEAWGVLPKREVTLGPDAPSPFLRLYTVRPLGEHCLLPSLLRNRCPTCRQEVRTLESLGRRGGVPMMAVRRSGVFSRQHVCRASAFAER